MQYPVSTSWAIQACNQKEGKIHVLKSELEERYSLYAVMPDSIFFAEEDSQGFLDIPAKKIISMENKLRKEIDKENSLKQCTERNARGKELELCGNTDEAISIYEENIKHGCWPATHSFDRLLVIYHSKKDYKNELRVCKRAISVFKSLDKYKERLDKISTLIGQK